MKTIGLLAAMALLLSACGVISNTRERVANIFAPSPEQLAQRPLRPLVPPNQVVRTVDARVPIAAVTAVEITPTTAGLLITASGTSATTGAYGAELVEVARNASGITYDLRVFPSGGIGDARLTAATTLSAAQSAGIRQITVRGAQGSVSRRR
ncbi:MAG: hypothetical protein ACU0DW_01875 [Shimia sp.]